MISSNAMCLIEECLPPTPVYSLSAPSKDMLDMYDDLDMLLGLRSHYRGPANEIIYDKTRNFYIDFIQRLSKATRLGNEFPRFLSETRKTFLSKKKRRPFTSADTLYFFLLHAACYCSFEPRWHMELRGDKKKLPNVFPNDCWGYLRSLYTDPEKSIIFMPDHVKRGLNKYRSYEDFVTYARTSGRKQLRDIYGNEVDLRLRPDGEQIKEEYVQAFPSEDILNGNFLSMIKKA